jgi:hypothetical protein
MIIDGTQAALGAPFAPNHIPRAVAQTPAQPAEHGQDVLNTSSKPITRSAELDAEAAAARDESWKAEYDQHLSGWREESAVRREAAEKERERWEKLKKGQRNPAPVFAGVLSSLPRTSINETHAHQYSPHTKPFRYPWSCNGRKGRRPRDRGSQRGSVAM